MQDDFIEVLNEMKPVHPDFEAVYDVVPMKATKVDAIEVIMTFLGQNKMTPEELFDVSDAYEDRLISHEDFVDRLRVIVCVSRVRISSKSPLNTIDTTFFIHDKPYKLYNLSS